MASGWDKSPGPDNDYASRDWPLTHRLVLLIALIVLFGGYAYLSLMT